MKPMLCVLLAAACLRVQAFDEIVERQTQAIEKSAKWLLKAQNRDGSWGLDPKTQGDVTCTALACMSLLADGNTEREGNQERVAAVRAGTEYLIKQARSAREDISSGQHTLIQTKLGQRVHNFFAVVSLTQVYGMRPTDRAGGSDDAGLRDSIQRLSEIIARSQERDGSWHKETFGSLKATGMAWLALRSADSTGVPIKHAAVDKTVEFIKAQYNPSTKLYDSGGKMQGYQALYATATCVRVLTGMGQHEKQALDAADAYIASTKSGEWSRMFLTVEGEDYLSAMMMTHALMGQSAGEKRWQNWFEFIREALCKRQNADGSWTTTACIRGTTFPTACAMLTLAAPNRLLPAQN